VLGRIRELRDLPGEIASIERQIADAYDSLQKEKSGQRRLAAEQENLEREHRRFASEMRVAKEEAAALDRELARSHSDLEWLASHEQRLLKEMRELDEQEVTYEKNLQQYSIEHAATSEDLRAAEASELMLRQNEEKLTATLSEARISFALNKERQVSLAEAIRRGESALTNMRRQLESKHSRTDEVESLQLSLDEASASSQVTLGVLAGQLRELECLTGPAELRIAELGAEYDTLQREDARLRTAYHELAAAQQRAALEAQRRTRRTLRG
jgi:chromosome segregation ATPase